MANIKISPELYSPTSHCVLDFSAKISSSYGLKNPLPSSISKPVFFLYISYLVKWHCHASSCSKTRNLEVSLQFFLFPNTDIQSINTSSFIFLSPKPYLNIFSSFPSASLLTWAKDCLDYRSGFLADFLTSVNAHLRSGFTTKLKSINYAFQLNMNTKIFSLD